MHSDRETSTRVGNTFRFYRTWYVAVADKIKINVFTITEDLWPSKILSSFAFDARVEEELAEAVSEIREWANGRKHPLSDVGIDAHLHFSCEDDPGYGDNDCYCNSSSLIVLSVSGSRTLTEVELEAEAAAKKKRKDAYKKKRDAQAEKELNELRNLAAKYPSEMKRLATMRAKKEKAKK